MTDWIGTILHAWGYWGVGLLMFIETVFPPIPSEVIMPLAGVQAAQQGQSLAGVVIAGTIGAMLGNSVWYGIAWVLGLDRFEQFLIRYGRVLTLDAREIERGRQLFLRYGAVFVGVGRVLPTIRSLISVPAGLVRMNPTAFFFYSTIGSFLWTMGLAIAGYLLGHQFEAVDLFLGPLSTAVLIVCFGIYFYRVLMWNRIKDKAN